jgi:hypothetical protein
VPVVRLCRLHTSPSGLGWCGGHRVVHVAARDSNPGRLPSGRWGVGAAVLTGRRGLLTMPFGVCLHPCARLQAGHPCHPVDRAGRTLSCGSSAPDPGGCTPTRRESVRLCCRNPSPSGSPSCWGGCPQWPVASASPGCSLALAGGWLVGWSEGFHTLPPLLALFSFQSALPLWWAALPSETHCTRLSDSVNPISGSFLDFFGNGSFGPCERVGYVRGASASSWHLGLPAQCGPYRLRHRGTLEGNSRRFVGRTAAHVASLLIPGTSPALSSRCLTTQQDHPPCAWPGAQGVGLLSLHAV